MPFGSSLTESDREQVQEALDTLNELGWNVTRYEASAERPYRREQTRLEVVAYKDP